MSIKRMLNLALAGLAAIGTSIMGVLLGTTAVSTITTGGAILASIGLIVGSAAMAVVSGHIVSIIVNSVKNEDYRQLDGMCEMLFETVLNNTMRIAFNAIVLGSLKTPTIPKFRIRGRRNDASVSTEVYEGEYGPVTVGTF